MGKLVMEAILETKAETILQFLRGLRGSLHVPSAKGAEVSRKGRGSGSMSYDPTCGFGG